MYLNALYCEYLALGDARHWQRRASDGKEWLLEGARMISGSSVKMVKKQQQQQQEDGANAGSGPGTGLEEDA